MNIQDQKALLFLYLDALNWSSERKENAVMISNGYSETLKKIAEYLYFPEYHISIVRYNTDITDVFHRPQLGWMVILHTREGRIVLKTDGKDATPHIGRALQTAIKQILEVELQKIMAILVSESEACDEHVVGNTRSD